MDTITAITSRRSVKQFDPDFTLPDVDANQIIELAALAPTAFNIQHWRFVTVKDPALRQQLRTVSWDQAQVTDASMLIILCADMKAWKKSPERYWKNSDKAVQDFILPAIDNYYRNNEQTQRDEALRSCGMAAQTIMLAAKALGYESCPMDGFDFTAVANLINLPEDHLISMYIAIGKPLQDAHPRAGQLPLADILIEDRF